MKVMDMINHPAIGRQVIKSNIPINAWSDFEVRPIRDLNDYQKIVAIRAAAFMCEQSCPFEEEFDGNDLNATHLLAYYGGGPVGTVRLRWFSGFGKIERVCVLKPWRGSPVIKVMLAHAFEIAARKGYQQFTAQIQARLWPVWSRMLHCQLRHHRDTFSFSGYDYKEIDIPIPKHPRAIDSHGDPYQLIRPEGDWDEPGILELSADRSGVEEAA